MVGLQGREARTHELLPSRPYWLLTQVWSRVFFVEVARGEIDEPTKRPYTARPTAIGLDFAMMPAAYTLTGYCRWMTPADARERLKFHAGQHPDVKDLLDGATDVTDLDAVFADAD